MKNIMQYKRSLFFLVETIEIVSLRGKVWLKVIVQIFAPSWAQRFVQLLLVILFPLETLFLWFLPRKIGTFYTALYFSWYPHYGLGIGRYKDSMFWVNYLPRYFTHSMQLHFVHRLHPNIGHWSELTPMTNIGMKTMNKMKLHRMCEISWQIINPKHRILIPANSKTIMWVPWKI